MSRILTYVVPEEDAGKSLKTILRSRLRLTNHQLAVLKSEAGIFVDGEPVHVSLFLRAGQRVSVRLPEAEAAGIEAQDVPVNVVYEDEDIIILDKEAPLACQSSPKQSANTLENRMMFRYRDQPYVFRPVNRLDKGTSGLMVVARHAYAQSILQSQLHTPDFVREYLAILDGVPDSPQGVIDAPIAKCEEATIRREISPLGKPSVTRYEVVKAGGGLALARLRLETGRTHQIRVHMSHIGCPVLGDFLYGREDERLPGRFALHSAHLELLHPVTRKKMCFDAPLSKELKDIICNF